MPSSKGKARSRDASAAWGWGWRSQGDGVGPSGKRSRLASEGKDRGATFIVTRSKPSRPR